MVALKRASLPNLMNLAGANTVCAGVDTESALTIPRAYCTSMPPQKTSLLKIGLALATLYIVWGSTYLAIRIGVETIPPFLMGAARFLVAGMILAIVVHAVRGFSASRQQWIDASICGFLMMVCSNGLVNWAEQKIPSGVATLIVALNPVYFVLAEWCMAHLGQREGTGERPRIGTVVGLAMGFVGLIILVRPMQTHLSQSADTLVVILPTVPMGASHSENHGSGLDMWRVSALLIACGSWTVGSLYSRYSRQPAEPFTASAMQMLTGSAWLFGVSFLLGEWNDWSWSSLSNRSLLAWSYLVVAGSLLGYTSFIWLMNHCSPTLVSTYAYVNPIVAVLLGWWFAGETIDSRIGLASVTIILGVAIISWSKRPAPAVSHSADK